MMKKKYWQFLILTCLFLIIFFQGSFLYRIPNHLALRSFNGLKGKKNMYRSTVIVYT